MTLNKTSRKYWNLKGLQWLGIIFARNFFLQVASPHTPITPGCCGLLCSTQSTVSVAVNTGSPTIVNIIRAEESHRKINKITAN